MTWSLAMSTIALLGAIYDPFGFFNDPWGSKIDPHDWTKTPPPATQGQPSGESPSNGDADVLAQWRFE